MKKDVQSKRNQEKLVIRLMIQLYCMKQHRDLQKNAEKLCQDCANLFAYASMRSDKCPFMETKTFCSNCKVHCYKSKMRQQIKEVMRFSGPRMIFYHPILALRHVVESKREKKRLEKNED